MRFSSVLLPGLTLVGLVISPRADATPGARTADEKFVGVRAASFVLDSKPFHFLGANVAVMHGPTERRRYRRVLRAAHADGLSVVRVWALGEGPAKASRWFRRWHLFRAGPKGWIAAAPRHLDKVLAHARKLGLRVILTLANNWSAYGGVPQYLRWARLSTSAFGALDRFYSNNRTRRWYRQHVLRLVNRKSTVTGLRYGDDPTIMAWELFNESGVTTGGFASRRKLIRRMAARIRTHAPEQLVSAGVTGYATLPRRAEWLKVCQLREIDFCDAHLYPEETLRLRRPRDLDELIDDRVQLAHHVARKPILFGEFGFTRAIAKRKRLVRRSQRWWVSRFLRRVHYNGAAGALIWLYLPHSKQRRRFPIWVDHRKSKPLRKVLRRWAARFHRGPPRRTNPRLGPLHGSKPMYSVQFTVRRKPPRRRWKVLPGPLTTGSHRREVRLEVNDFRRAHFSDVGYYGGGLVEHVYGGGHGFWEYRIPRLRSRARARELELSLRLSSEYPGAKAPSTGGSRVVVKLDGREVARLLAAPDDGQGTVHKILIRDPRLLAALRRRSLTLRLEVPWGSGARGLCIYGRLGTQGVLQKHKPQGSVGPLRITATLASAR
jgi:mannan endo-1,4-beta-mannosidase